MHQESEIMFQVIDKLIDKKLKTMSFDRTGIIENEQDGDGFLKVNINGYSYSVKNGTNIKFGAGDRCLVHYINGSENSKVIIAKMNGEIDVESLIYQGAISAGYEKSEQELGVDLVKSFEYLPEISSALTRINGEDI